MRYWILLAAVVLLVFNILFGAGVIVADRRRRKALEGDLDSMVPAIPIEDIFSWFLPEELLEMLQLGCSVKSPKDILEGQKEVQAVVLSGNITDFTEGIHNMEAEDVYAFMNRALSYMIPVVYKNGGIIDSFRGAGIRALFTRQMADGLNAAVLICEEMLKPQKDWNHKEFSLGLCYGRVCAGVVGYGKRLSVLTLSTYTGFAEFLQKMGAKYYAKILAAESYVEHVKNFRESYNFRFLGIFFVRVLDREEKIYDVFDGDETGIRNHKRKTKMLFEKGVSLFLERDFKEARVYFIEVLKADHSDKAAREYIYLCDTYSSMPSDEKKKVSVYLEYF